MARLPLIRKQEPDLPLEVNIKYVNAASNYQAGAQYDRRLTVSSDTVITLELALVMTDSEAKSLCTKILYEAWKGRNSFAGFKLPRRYTFLEPGDVITLIDDTNGVSYLIRLLTKNKSGNFIEFTAEAEDLSIYNPIIAGGDSPSSTNAEITISDTRLELMDLPLLLDNHAEYGIYVAVCQLDAPPEIWGGATIYKSSDAGETYNNIMSLGAQASIGDANTVLGDWTGGNVFDQINTVQITLTTTNAGTLSSVSELTLLNGSNTALLGNEIIQFRTATLQDDGSYILSDLLRGRRGTEWATGTHRTSERFVLLNSTTVDRMSSTSGELNLSRLYRPVSFNADFDLAADQSFTNRGESLRPYAPVQLSGYIDSATNDWIINWVRRTRVGGSWVDLTDVPLGETTESYEVDIISTTKNISAISKTSPIKVTTSAAHGYSTGNTTHLVGVKGMYEVDDKSYTITVVDSTNFYLDGTDGTNFGTYISGGVAAKVIRTLSSTTQTVTYTSAQQTTDFGGNQTSITPYVQQISSTIGRGRSVRATLS